MQQRTSSGSGRPSGTDGSDFSYRMVVDSRYTKVAKGKSRLAKLFVIQAVIQLVGFLFTCLSMSKEVGPNQFAIPSVSLGLASLLVGELGRRRSQVIHLTVSMVVLSFAVILSVFAKTNSILEVINNSTNREAKKLELFDTACVVLGVLVQIFLVSTVIALAGNMAPPKKA